MQHTLILKSAPFLTSNDQLMRQFELKNTYMCISNSNSDSLIPAVFNLLIQRQKSCQRIATCCSDGTMIETFGPFYSDGRHNDQHLWDYIWSENLENIQQHLDCATVKGLADRGFTRCESSLKLLVPDSIKKGEKQLSTEQANRYESRSNALFRTFCFCRTRKLTHYRGTDE